MKIGYIRKGLDINFFDNKKKDLGIYDRTRVIKSMIEQGHDVVLLSPLSSTDEKLKSYKTLIEPPDWFKKLEYRKRFKFEKKDFEDIDILFIENGPDNTLFSYKNKSYFRIMCESLDLWEGKVIYWQHSPVLSFPFGEYFSERSIENINENNIRYLLKTYDIFKDKEWLILHHSLNEKRWKELVYCRAGYRYKDIEELVDLKFRFIPYAYEPEDDPWLGPSYGEKWELVWIGGRYSSSSGYGSSSMSDRYPSIKEYFENIPYRTAIIGQNWEGIKNINNLGYIGKVGDGWKLYNKGLVGLWTDSQFVKESGFMTQRPFEVIQSGNLLLGVEGFYGIEKYVNKDYIISSKKELIELIEWYKDLSNEEKNEIRIKQISKFDKWSDIKWKEVIK